MEICKKEKCTGCFACYNVCPQKCIQMKEDKLGYIYPKIDETKCKNCGLCREICPQLEQPKLVKPQHAYAVYNREDSMREASTSGGVAATFYRYIIEKNGVVYGVDQIQQGKVNFIRVDKVEKLDSLKGSKYVHAYVQDAFAKVKKDLMKQIPVLFIGTPCQIDGLKAYLRRDYNNLITIDIICHGVPSQQFLRDELKQHIKDINSVQKVTFRTRNAYELKIDTLKKENKNEKKMAGDYYLLGFMNALFLRENCYHCPYAKVGRVSDMTIGDFWGLSEDAKLYDKEGKGVSLVMPITNNGAELLQKCQDKLRIEERTVEEAVKGNTQLRHPSIRSKYVVRFKKNYYKKGYIYAYKKARTLKQALRENQTIYKIYKKIKGR